MAGIGDWRDIGVFPLQDHGANVTIGRRQQIAGCRIVRMDDDATGDDLQVSIGVENDMGTVGDIHPWLYWQTADREKRDTGSWSQVFAAMCVDFQSSGGGPTTPGSGGSSTQASVLPIRGLNYNGDGRYKPKGSSWPRGMPSTVKGQLLLVGGMTEEGQQREWIMNGDPRIWAPTASGPGECATLVCDLQPTREACMDGSTIPGVGGRHARINSIFRVIAMPTSGNTLSAGNAVALNYGRTFDGFAGYGMIYGDLASRSTGPTTPGGHSGPTTPGSGGGRTTPFTDSANESATNGKAIMEFGRFAPVQTIGGLGVMSNSWSGPIIVGAANDKHIIQQDRDGHPLMSAHISTNAYFFRDSDKDGPLLFEGNYPNPNPLPMQGRVHLSYDGGTQHAFALGARQGVWRWWCEVPYVIPDRGTPNSQVPPGGGGGGGGGRGPTTPGGPGGPGAPGGPPGGPPGPTTPGGPGAPGGQGAGPTTPGAGVPGGPPTGGSGPGGREKDPNWKLIPCGPRIKPPHGLAALVQLWNPPVIIDPWKDPGYPGPPPNPGYGHEISPTPEQIRKIREDVERDRQKREKALRERLGDPSWLRDQRQQAQTFQWVGGATQHHRNLFVVHYPFAMSNNTVTWRPHLYQNGLTSLEHNPDAGIDTIRQREQSQPTVLIARAWGAQATDGFNYTAQPGDSLARGGTVSGGLLFQPPEFMMEDYLGVGSSNGRNVDSPTTTSWLAAATGVGFAIGHPNTDGGLAAKSWTIARSGETTTISALDSTRTSQAMMTMQLVQSGGAIKCAFAGTAGLRIPSGTTAQRWASATGGEIRVNTTLTPDAVEYYNAQSAAWKRVLDENDISSTVQPFAQNLSDLDSAMRGNDGAVYVSGGTPSVADPTGAADPAVFTYSGGTYAWQSPVLASSTMVWIDDFMTNTVTWAQWVSGGGVYNTPSSSGHPGVLRVTNGGGAGGYAGTYSATQCIVPQSGITWEATVNVGAIAAGSTYRLGLSDMTSGTAAPANGMMFELVKDTSANWVIRSTKASTTTTTTSGTAATTGWHRFKITYSGGTATFYLNGTSLGTVSSSTYLPTAAVSPFFFAYCTAASYAWLDPDYCKVTITGLSR